MKLWLSVLLLLAGVAGVSAASVEINDGCHFGTVLATYITFNQNVTVNPVGDLLIENNCTVGTQVEWGLLNLSLGNITQGEVILGKDFAFVDSVARPDLDQPATLRFKGVAAVFVPKILRDGVDCGVNCTNVLYDQTTSTLSFDVSGFSNYSLQGLQQFTVYSDPQPELYDRVYQAIDLGNAYRNERFKCIVQLYGRNDQAQWILMQTNPERKVAARLFGSPDTNNPESLGYFPTESGLANVYFDGSKVAGYEEYEYVVQCANNSTKLVYEESISTRYRSAARGFVGRAQWLANGWNAFILVIAFVVGLLALLLVLKGLNMLWRILRGY